MAVLLIAPGIYQLKQANSFGQANVSGQLGLGATNPRSHTDSLSPERTNPDTKRHDYRALSQTNPDVLAISLAGKDENTRAFGLAFHKPPQLLKKQV